MLWIFLLVAVGAEAPPPQVLTTECYGGGAVGTEVRHASIEARKGEWRYLSGLDGGLVD